MPGESLLFLAIIFVAFIFFVKEIFPIDVTALALLAALLATDFLSIEEAISGFSNQAVLTVALMFILSSALVKTGFLEVITKILPNIIMNERAINKKLKPIIKQFLKIQHKLCCLLWTRTNQL